MKMYFTLKDCEDCGGVYLSTQFYNKSDCDKIKLIKHAENITQVITHGPELARLLCKQPRCSLTAIAFAKPPAAVDLLSERPELCIRGWNLARSERVDEVLSQYWNFFLQYNTLKNIDTMFNTTGKIDTILSEEKITSYLTYFLCIPIKL